MDIDTNFLVLKNGHSIVFNEDKIGIKIDHSFMTQLIIGIANAREKAKQVTDKKDYKLSSISLHPDTYQDIRKVFNMAEDELIFDILDVPIFHDADMTDENYIEYHYSYVIFEMGTKK